MSTHPLRTLALLPLCTLLACGSGQIAIDHHSDELETGFSYDEPPSTVQCGAFFEMVEHTPETASAAVGVTDPIEGLFLVRGDVEETEADDCDLAVEIRLVVDTNTSPDVLDWTELPAQRLWQYDGNGEWWLGIVPQRDLQSGETYAVEADFHVAGELPHGYVWSWSTAP